MVSESWYAHEIAQLEGRKRLRYLNDFSADSTLQGLDLRLRRIEAKHGAAALPPMLEPTWESMEYRIQQLWGHGVQFSIASATVTTLTLPGADIQHPKTMQEVKSISRLVFAMTNDMIGSIVARTPTLPVVLTADDDEAKKGEQLGEIAQRLCYLAGTQNKAVPDFDDDVDQVYALAVQLAAGYQNIGTPFGPPGRKPPIMPGIAVAPGRNPCCGCCSCQCHANRSGLGAVHGSMPHLVNIQSPKPKNSGARSFIPGWIKSLWCFGSRRSSASSLTSSRSSSTLADD